MISPSPHIHHCWVQADLLRSSFFDLVAAQFLVRSFQNFVFFLNSATLVSERMVNHRVTESHRYMATFVSSSVSISKKKNQQHYDTRFFLIFQTLFLFGIQMEAGAHFFSYLVS